MTMMTNEAEFISLVHSNRSYVGIAHFHAVALFKFNSSCHFDSFLRPPHLSTGDFSPAEMRAAVIRKLKQVQLRDVTWMPRCATIMNSVARHLGNVGTPITNFPFNPWIPIVAL